MADYVSREVARERLRKACKAGSIVSVLLLLAGIGFGAICGVLAAEITIPDYVTNVLRVIVPTWSDPVLAMAETGTKAALFFLIGLLGILMFRRISKTGDAFGTKQLKRFKFIAFLLTLLAFMPTLVGNGIKVFNAIQSGSSPFAVMSFAVDAIGLVAGLFVFMAARVLVDGAVLGAQEEQVAATSTSSFEPDYEGVPDLAHVPTATAEVPETTMLDGYGLSDAQDDQQL